MQTERFSPSLAQRVRALTSMPVAALSNPTLPRFKMYGGATITGAHDATGREHTLFCAKDLTTNTFGLYGVADDVPVLLAPVSGRGSVWVSLFDGMGYWKGWEGETKRGGAIPGFVPFPSIPALAVAIAQLRETAQAGVPGPQGPPGAPGAPGAGGVVLFPAPLTSAAWEGRTLNGGEAVDIPATFGCAPAAAYLIRFVAQSNTADVRVRAGTIAAPFFLTLNLVVPKLQAHIQGFAPGPIAYISTAQGEAKIWLQVVGYSG
jgi:hypothetical protein